MTGVQTCALPILRDAAQGGEDLHLGAVAPQQPGRHPGAIGREREQKHGGHAPPSQAGRRRGRWRRSSTGHRGARPYAIARSLARAACAMLRSRALFSGVSNVRAPSLHRRSMQTVILAGGLGTRLAEETEVRPKPMVEIGRASCRERVCYVV